MINLKDITEKNLLSIIYLTPADNQKDQVAPNSVSIAQGLFSKTAWFKGVFYNDIPVGFVMLDLNKKEKNVAYGVL